MCPHETNSKYSSTNYVKLDKIMKNMSRGVTQFSDRDPHGRFITKEKSIDFEKTFLNYYRIITPTNIPYDDQDYGTSSSHYNLLLRPKTVSKNDPPYTLEKYPTMTSIRSKEKYLKRIPYETSLRDGNKKNQMKGLSEHEYKKIFPDEIHNYLNHGNNSARNELMKALENCVNHRNMFRGRCILPCGLKNDGNEGEHHGNYIEKVLILLAHMKARA